MGIKHGRCQEESRSGVGGCDEQGFSRGPWGSTEAPVSPRLLEAGPAPLGSSKAGRETTGFEPHGPAPCRYWVPSRGQAHRGAVYRVFAFSCLIVSTTPCGQ